MSKKIYIVQEINSPTLMMDMGLVDAVETIQIFETYEQAKQDFDNRVRDYKAGTDYSYVDSWQGHETEEATFCIKGEEGSFTIELVKSEMHTADEKDYETVKIEMYLEVDKNKGDSFKQLEHHAEYLIDSECFPEIRSIYGVKVDVKK